MSTNAPLAIAHDIDRVIDAAGNRAFTKSQSEDFWGHVDRYFDTLEDPPQRAYFEALFAAKNERDEDGFKAAWKQLRGIRGERKTSDGNPGQPPRWPASNYSLTSTEAGNMATPGRKSVNTESWGELVWQSGSPDGLKALVPSGSTAVPLTLTPQPVTDAQRVNFLRQLIPTQRTETGNISYLVQSARTTLAAVVAEGERKPTSVYSLTREDDRVDTIAHLSEAIPRQYLDDADLLRGWVDSELRYGLDLALDAEIVAAILAAAAAGTAGGDLLTSMRNAITDLETVDLAPNGIAMSPADWATVELEAASTFAANPTMSPTNALTRRLYGVPVVITTALNDEGAAVVGAFDTSALLFLRQEARVDWSEAVFDPTFDSNVGATDFERNLIRFRAEMRAKLAITRPAGFVQVATGS